MQFFNFFSSIFNDNFLGVDIGNFSIKLAELSKEKDKIKVLIVDEIVIPKDKKGTITDDEISTILLTLIGRNNIRTKKVIFSIENSFTNYVTITLPKMKNKEILKYVELNFEEFLPVRFEDIHLEWKVLEEDGDNIKILLITVNKEIILRYKKIAQNVKLEFHSFKMEENTLKFYSFEIEANALINSLVDKKEEKDLNVILLDVRMKNSSLSLVKNGNILKSSSLNLSVNYFDKDTK